MNDPIDLACAGEPAPSVTLCDALDRILNQGVVLHGDITVSVAGVDLLFISLRGLVAAADIIIRSGEDSTRLPLTREMLARSQDRNGVEIPT